MLNVVVVLFDIGAYIANVKMVNTTTICFDLQPCIFIGMIFAVLNVLFYIYFCRLGFASDQEWSRIIIFMGVDLILQAISVLVVFAIVRSLIN